MKSRAALTSEPASTADRVVVAAFLACLVVPGVVTCAAPSEKPMAAMGEMASEVPKLDGDWRSIRRWPRTYRDWFDANFAGRGALIAAHAAVKVDVLDVSSNSKVIVGKDGWLYYAAEREDECCRNADPYTPEELEQVVRTLEARRARLAERGVDFLLVCAPDKHTIYPEFLPDSVRPVRPRSRLDQLEEAVRRDTQIDFLDLRPMLLEAKRREQVYFRLDTHWNDVGAFLAYGEIMARLGRRHPELRAASRDEFEARPVDSRRDLGNMLGLAEPPVENGVSLAPKTPRRARLVAGSDKSAKDDGARVIDFRTYEVPDAKGPRVLVFRDSFASWLLPYLSEHFPRVTYVHAMGLDAFDEEVVLREKPDVVVEEFVERSLMLDPKPAKPKGDDAR